ncbi:PREDICTED: protein FAM32A isoform X1 [Chinchilla lanigera]|uniref:protein FAM32A isoform X1 n=1 Tax=Chinchilla lanigera TaxID=34839 RepID=UPI0006976476|nr:PREDICTED: protein FAM32A isoform X1 [Chinchilla lanigera]
MEAYEQVQKGPLKLKGVAELGVTKRKKKKKDKDKAQLLEAMGTSKKGEEEKRRCLDKRTPAQAAFEKMQEKRQMERILKKASRTHKQRVEAQVTWHLCSPGLQQAPGHPHRALRHPQSQLDQVGPAESSGNFSHPALRLQPLSLCFRELSCHPGT